MILRHAFYAFCSGEASLIIAISAKQCDNETILSSSLSLEKAQLA